MKKSLLFLFLGVIFASSAADADQKVMIAVDRGNPPFMYEKNATAEGIYPRVLSAIFERMGVGVSIKALPWKRALRMAEKGEVGVGGIYKTGERLKIYDYSMPIHSERILVYVPSDEAFAFRTLSDLEGKAIGSLLGWSYGDAFDAARRAGKMRIEEVNNDHLNFKKLTNGSLDCVLALELTGNLIIRREKYQDSVVALEKPLAENETFLVFSKDAGRKALLDRFNAKLTEMREDGTFDLVVTEYLQQLK